jgi:hypothetical protein
MRAAEVLRDLNVISGIVRSVRRERSEWGE